MREVPGRIQSHLSSPAPFIESFSLPSSCLASLFSFLWYKLMRRERTTKILINNERTTCGEGMGIGRDRERIFLRRWVNWKTRRKRRKGLMIVSKKTREREREWKEMFVSWLGGGEQMIQVIQPDRYEKDGKTDRKKEWETLKQDGQWSNSVQACMLGKIRTCCFPLSLPLSA